jgi:hypothetical protein
MQVDWENRLQKYYPKLNQRTFKQCLQEIHEWKLPKEEFLYVVLGCGYLFYVRRLDPERVFEETKQDIGNNPRTADLILDEKKIRKKISKLGLVIGPEERPLTDSHKRGPRPRPTARITSLAIDAWIRKKDPMLEPAELTCGLHYALTGQKIQVTTFIRTCKKAEGVRIKKYLPAEKDISPIDHLVDMFESRYKRCKQRYRDRELPIEEISDLYPIKGVIDMVLMAVGVDLPQLH